MKVSAYIVLGFLGLGACKETQTQTEVSKAQAVHTIEVQRGDITKGHLYLANVAASQSVKIAAQVPGTFSRPKIAENTEVTKGRVIGAILTPDIGARVSRVRAERKRAERERDFVCQMAKTDSALAKSGDLSRFALEKSTKNCESAQLAVTAAKFAEKEARFTKGKATERAPFDGRVLKYLIDDGQKVGPGSPILLFGSQRQYLSVRVPEGELKALKVGSKAVSDQGDGKIIDIGAQAFGPARLVEVRVELDSQDYLLPGSSIKVTLVTNREEGVTLIPLSALGEDENGNFVVIVKDGKQQRQKVTTGLRSKGMVSLLAPLEKGTRIIDGGLSSLNSEMPIWEVAQ